MATNRRQQIQLSPDEQAEFFRARKKAALATIDKDGRNSNFSGRVHNSKRSPATTDTTRG